MRNIKLSKINKARFFSVVIMCTFLISGCHITHKIIAPSFSGKVLDRESKQPLANITVINHAWENNKKEVAITNAQGEFHFLGITELVVYPLLCCVPAPYSPQISIDSTDYELYSDRQAYDDQTNSMTIYLKKRVDNLLPPNSAP